MAKITSDDVELGQMAFGVPISEYACPAFIAAGLEHLANEIERVEWNIRQEQYCAPTGNNGQEYETPVFQMRAYYWGDAEAVMELPNFESDGLEIRWYKHLGRGMSMNQDIDANTFFRVIDRCVKSVRDKEQCEGEDKP